MNLDQLHIDLDRLHGRILSLGEIGALPGGGVARLALSDADRAGRDLVTAWMRDLGLDVTVDRIGNVLGVRPGAMEAAPEVTGDPEFKRLINGATESMGKLLKSLETGDILLYRIGIGELRSYERIMFLRFG